MKWNTRNDEGASLILVIIFVMIFAVVIAAILNFASTGFKTTEEIVNVRNSQQAVDGAMDAAINSVRRSTAYGAKGSPTPCPTYTYNSSSSSDPTVTVTCAADTTVGTGSPGEEIPKYAVLTGLWGDPSATCKGFIETGNDVMKIDGGIFSNGHIAVGTFGSGSSCTDPSGSGSKTEMDVAGDALAYFNCTPIAKIIVTGRIGCQNSGTRPSKETLPTYEPHYANAAAVASAAAASYGGSASAYYDPLPTCNSGGFQAVFLPGVYTELPSYHAQRKGCSTGSGSFFWFKPGTYYFDFPSDDATWDIGAAGVNVIGGTLKSGFNPTTSWGTTHTGCDDDPATTNPGVQFIFGGPSRWVTKGNGSGSNAKGVVDLCAGANPDTTVKQRLVVYALETKSAHNTRPSAVSVNATTCPSSVRADCFLASGNPTSTTFSPAANAKTPDGSAASYTFHAPTTGGATLSYSGFTTPSAFDGATISPANTSIYAEIIHSESGGSLSPSILVKSTSKPAGVSIPLSGCTNTGTSGSFTVTKCTITGLQDPFLWKEVKSITIDYTVADPGLTCTTKKGVTTCDPDRTAQVDSIALKVAYQGPGFETQSSSSPFLTTTSNPETYFEGTFFAPYSELAVNVHNDGLTEFARGVIASHITGTASSSAKQDGAPFKLPGLTDRRVVLFTASVNTKVRLRARVAYDDLTGYPGKTATVLDWQVVRG